MTRQAANLLFILGESHAPHLLGAIGNPYIRTPPGMHWRELNRGRD